MALDWDFIHTIGTKKLSEDQDDARTEILYDQLIQYDLNGSETIEQLKKLFECSKLVMRFKSNQVDVAIEEIDELENIISRENVNQKNLVSNLDKNNLKADKQKNEQLLEVERTNELLRTQLKEKDIELNRLEQTKSNLEQTLKLNERQLSNYNQEIEQLREELQIEKEQINEQLANNNLPFEQLRDMNEKFYMLLEEMKDMETMNTQLGEKVMKLNEELNSATQQIQMGTKEIEYMKKNLNNMQEMNDILINEKEDHLKEIRKLKSITDNYEIESDEHLGTSSRKIQDLQEKLRSKEEELNQLKLRFKSIDKKQIDEEKAYFLKEISKRDNHIKLLRNQLSQAIDDIEAQTRVIENLIEKNIENIHKSDSVDQQDKSNQNGRAISTNQLINKLEEELRSKDKEMTILYQRNTLYEKGVFGLSEAVEEINKLSKLIKSKNDEIDKLIKELNSINLKLSNTQDELDYLKEIMNADEDLKEKLNENSEVKNDKLRILKLQKEVIRLEADKLKLHEEVLSHKLGGNLGKKKIFSNDSSNVTANDQSTNENLKDMKQLQQLNSIRELTNENRELQLAMKEILIGLKQSDSKSDVIIDCPSLERLCQFFESRSINSSLTNVIALKAELDILRGHNEELRMTNKRLRNDIFKIFENYSKHLLVDFVNKNQSEELKEGTKNVDDENKNYINQTLTEDEFYDSDLSEGEIVLSSKSIIPKEDDHKRQDNKQDQEVQTDLDYRFMNEIDVGDKERKIVNTNKLDEDLKKDENMNNEKDQVDLTDQLSKDENTEHTLKPSLINEKSLIDQMTQTELCLDDLRNVDYLKKIDEIEEILKIHSVNDLKELINRMDLIDKESTKQTKPIKRSDSFTKYDLRNKKDATCQTTETPLLISSEEIENNQWISVQNLLIEFRAKIDRFDSILQKEDYYSERIKVLEEENNRLQDELKIMIELKDDLLNKNLDKEKQIIELKDKIDQKEKMENLEIKSIKNEENKKLDKDPSSNKNESSMKDNESKNKKSEKNENQPIDQTKLLDKQSIDSQLAIIRKFPVDSSNQRGLISIVETIIKCLLTRIEHKDESIAYYQQLLIKRQEEHQLEIQKVMKNYKKVTEHSIKAIQSSSNISQEQLDTTLVKYNEQLNECKSTHQKVLAEQKKALELQMCKLRKLKNENERLKSQSLSTEELIRLRSENNRLNQLVEENVKFIEKLKNAIKKERTYKQENEFNQDQFNQVDPSKIIQLNKLKEEIENLYKLLISKDKQIKELQLSKWNLEKKISEVNQANRAELKTKSDELERMTNEQLKLKSLLEKIEKEKNLLRKKQMTVIKESTTRAQMHHKETQTEKSVNFDLNNQENASMFIDKFRQLDQTIGILKEELQLCSKREQELILERKEFKQEDDLKKDVIRSKKEISKELSIKSSKGRSSNKKNSCDF